MKNWIFGASRVLALAGVYFLAAKLGLSLNAISGFAAVVWPPTGIALVALVYCGIGLWPGIFLGAFLINWMTGAPAAVALAIATGNTLEAAFGCQLLRRAGFRPELDRLEDVAKLVVLAAGLSTVVSATIGVASLHLGGMLPSSAIRGTWMVWWLGDIMGDLVAAPFLFVWASRRTAKDRGFMLAEASILLMVGCVIAVLHLPGLAFFAIQTFQFHPYLVFPLIIWAALRFRQNGTVSMTVLISALTIWGTVTGHVSFTSTDLSQSLMRLQTFMAVAALTGLVLAAVVAERNREKSQLEEAIQASEKSRAHTAAILASALDSIISMDQDGKIVEFNPAAERMFGHSRQQAIGREMAELIIPEHLRQAHRRGLAHYIATGEGPVLGIRIEVSAQRADGTQFPVELSIHRLQTDGPAVFTGYLRDITERSRSEQERAQLLELEKDAKLKLGVQFEVMSALAESRTLAEAAPRILEAIGKNLNWNLGALWVVNGDGSALQALDLWQDERTNAPEFVADTRARPLLRGEGMPGQVWSQGKPLWLSDVTGQNEQLPRLPSALVGGLRSAFAFPIVIEGRKVLGVVEFFSTSVRAPDEPLLATVATLGGQIGQFVQRVRAEQELIGTIHAREQDLRSIRDEREVREKFVATLSHDLRNPLSAAKTSAQLLLMRIEARDFTERHASRIVSSIDRADKMIQDLLDANRIRAGHRLPLRIDSCDLRLVVQEAVEDLTLVHGNRFTIQAPEPVEGHWSLNELRRVIDNLAVNAVKYGDPLKPVTISLTSSPDQVTIGVHNEGNCLTEEEQISIFEPFRRTSGADLGKQKGWGLGLTLARGIAEAHGGGISVRSGPATGTTFTVTLPRDSRPCQLPAELAPGLRNFPDGDAGSQGKLG